MARQFRSDDTSSWSYRFGTGAQGSKTWSSTTTLGSSDNYNVGSFTGTSGATTGPTGIANATYNLPCIIHQTQGTGATAAVNWEFNFLISVSGGTATLAFPLTLTFNSGAQIVTSGFYSSVVVNAVVSSPAWGGSSGGIIPIFATNSVTGSGQFTTGSLGFRGGVNWNSIREGQQGEGTPGIGSNTFPQQPANGNGGGGGTTNAGQDSSAGGGAGGGNASSGTSGTAGSIRTNQGTGGSSVGSADLTSMALGGAGGQGGGEVQSPPGGSNGGGIIVVVARTINLPNINATSASGGNSIGGTAGGGGAGAGGSILLKGQNITLTNIAATAGTGGAGNNGAGNGGAGSVGRIHADYLITPTGSSNPGADTRFDGTLADTGSALFNFL